MIYLDTGCLLKLYYPEPESERIAKLVRGENLAFLPRHELEISNALELKRFRREASAAEVRATADLLEEDRQAGVLYRPSVGWEDVLRAATALARAHTRSLGCRSLDIVHCAAAGSLRATAFVTTDVRQRKLALKIGLDCPRV